MWVVKLGGSLMGSPALKGWLDALAQYGDGKIVIVPGGGIFADAVREAQAQTFINDATAHQMAVLAMDQYAMLMTGLNPDLVMASSELEIAENGWQHRAVIWKPSAMVLADKSLPMTWDLSSDSLAAWLAAKLNAEHLLIVKSLTQITDAHMNLDSLIEAGWVDKCFAQYAAHQCFQVRLLTQQDYRHINHRITHQSAPPMGTEIITRSAI